jgi:hypothetical protein
VRLRPSDPVSKPRLFAARKTFRQFIGCQVELSSESVDSFLRAPFSVGQLPQEGRKTAWKFGMGMQHDARQPPNSSSRDLEGSPRSGLIRKLREACTRANFGAPNRRIHVDAHSDRSVGRDVPNEG